MKRRAFLLNEGMSSIEWEVPKPGDHVIFTNVELDIADNRESIGWYLTVHTKEDRKETLDFIRRLHDEITAFRDAYVAAMQGYADAEKKDKEQAEKDKEENEKK